MKFLNLCCLLLVSCVAGPLATAVEFALNPIFNEHMVLQRDQAIRIWGTAEPGTAVQVSVAEQSGEAVSADDGKWLCSLPALAAGGPHVLTVTGPSEIVLNDILIGDVWLCSGQSNMGWRVNSSNDAKQEIANAQWPQIRLFSVALRTKQALQESVEGTWSVCSPETVGNFSAVGYFFGRDLHKDIQVPIGLINSSWGGTPAEAWTSRESLQAHPELSPITDRFADSLKNYDERAAAYLEAKKAWEAREKDIKKLDKTQHTDPGNKGFDQGWAAVDADLSEWTTATLPGMWSMNIDGAVWYRRQIEIPEALAGKDVQLHLGAIDDFDHTYLNNQEIGHTGSDTPNFWQHKRVYTIPAEKVQAGTASLAVRVFDHLGGGGFAGSANEMFLQAGDVRVPLSGEWLMRVELALDPMVLKNAAKPRPPMGPDHSHAPAGLYNAMIYPLMPLAIKGAIWYQGETNGGRGFQYRTLLPTMIADWRRGFQSGPFPFLTVQLANWRAPSDKPSAGGWPELREAQLLTAQNDPQGALAVTIDIGEADDIHPRNKQDVGKRLWLAAAKIAYGKDVVHSGPNYASMTIEDGQIRLAFTDIGSGLVAKGGPLQRFSIAGADQVFYYADATIDGDHVIVRSDKVAEPQAVRYAWSINPAGCNLYNAEDLPASPFRTDDWPLHSKDAK